jgi:hypothetical protein
LNDEDDEEGDRDDNTDYTHQTDGELVPPTAGYFADSADNLLLSGTGNDEAPYQSPNAQYDFGGPQNGGAWGSDYDKKDPRSPRISPLGYSSCDTAKESGDMVVKEVPPPLVSACGGLVTDGTIALTPKNFTVLEPLAKHVSGQLQTTEGNR